MSSASERRPQGRSEFWSTVRASLRSDQAIDFTRIPVRRAMLLLAVPMMAEMAMESVFAVVDIFFVAQLGHGAVAAVGLTEAMLTLVMAVAIGLATATTAMVARRVGENLRTDAAIVAAQALWVGLVVSILVAAVAIPGAPRLLALMGASDEVIATGSGYTAFLLGGSVTVVYLFVVNAVFRGAGDAALAFRTLWLANGINIVLDPILIFGLGPAPELGVTGAAVATTIGRGVGAAYGIALLFRAGGRIPLSLDRLAFVPSVALRLCRIAASGVFQFLIATSSWVVLMSLVARFGSVAVAGYTIAVRVLVFTFLPAWGLGNAAGTLVGQFLGAGRPRRAEAAAWLACRYNVRFLVTAGVLTIVFANPLAAFFSSEPAVQAHAAAALVIIALGYGFYAVGMILVQAINGAGDTDTPMLLNLVCFWLLQLPLAWWLATAAGFGERGVFWAVMIAESVLALLAWVVFRRGAWKRHAV